MTILEFIYWVYDIEPHVPALALFIILPLHLITTGVYIVGLFTIVNWGMGKRKSRSANEKPKNVNDSD